MRRKYLKNPQKPVKFFVNAVAELYSSEAIQDTIIRSIYSTR
jgi:hypothetical protein